METIQIEVDGIFFNVMGDIIGNHFKVEEVIWKRFETDGSISFINVTEILIILGGVTIIQRITDECNSQLKQIG